MATPPPPPARLPDLRATSVRALRYADPDAALRLGLPPHVRAASSAALVGDRLFVAQDDVHALAVIDLATYLAEPLPLGLPGALARAREEKADLEACALLPNGKLLVMGSGSRLERRVVLEVDLVTGAARPLASPPLYEVLSGALARDGAKVNIEGITIASDAVHFLHRGTGAGERSSPSVIVRMPAEAFLSAVYDGVRPSEGDLRFRAVDLGNLDGVRLSWTDGVDVYGLGLVFTATAEATSDVEEDAPCVGSALGVFDRAGRVAWARVLSPDGAPLRAKVEGVALAGDRAWLVVDDDDPLVASRLVEIPFGTPFPREGA